MSLEEAVAVVKSRRDVKPNPGFLHQLIDYEEKISAEKNIDLLQK